MTNRWQPVALLLAWAAAATPVHAQWTAELTVEETAGIRRTAFPARARLEIPVGRLGDARRVRLVDAGDDVPVQGTARTVWPDGSVRELALTFNLSLGPHEAHALELRYGANVPVAEAQPRGLTVTEGADGIQVGRLRLGDRAPLVRSVAYREELVVEGRNGVAVLDDRGVWHHAPDIAWDPVQIVERGPLTVVLAYRGLISLAGERQARVAVELEMPNSKSWLKVSATAVDPDARLRAVAIETPLHLGSHPWTWDFGTPNGTYGAFRDAASSTLLDVGVPAGAWRVRAGAPAEERPYEEGPRMSFASGTWAHVVGAREAVAFAVETGDAAGTVTARLSGTGQTSFELAPPEPTSTIALTVYQHYVSTPVAIGAATSPASILSPLRVSVR